MTTNEFEVISELPLKLPLKNINNKMKIED